LTGPSFHEQHLRVFFRLGWVQLFAICLGAAACQQRAPPAPEQNPPSSGPRTEPAATYPINVDRTQFAGSEKCGSCHAAEHAEWLKSPHGKSVREPSAAVVLGDFNARPIEVDGGSISFSREGGRYFMELHHAGEVTRHAVELVLGSGRQHQDYFTRDQDPRTGATVLRMMPAIWTTPDGPWISSNAYQPGSVDPKSARSWRKYNAVDAGCFNCHVSQGGYRMAATGPEPIWTETRVNCESCHGAGADHVAHKLAGTPGGAIRNLRDVGHVEEGMLCATCHGPRQAHRAGEDAHGFPWFTASTLRSTGLRVDGTQHGTMYQYSGHVLSECYAKSGMMCSTCHAPHSGAERTLDGEPADGPRADKQCTACHRDFLDVKVVRAHEHHQKPLRCIDCHMSQSFIEDTAATHQRTSDHSISIPRPAESAAFGTPNACTTCHTGKTPQWALQALTKWKQTKALAVRPWVRAVFDGRAKVPQAKGELAAMLEDRQSGLYRDESALDLLELQPPDPGLAKVIEPWTRDADPWVRALAYRALFHHDAANAGPIWDRAQADPHALVRLTMFPLSPDAARLTVAGIERYLRDDLEWAQAPPPLDLANAARAMVLKGDLARGLELVGLAERSATAHEAEALRLAALRESLSRLPVPKP
jgi:hypothetical protein